MKTCIVFSHAQPEEELKNKTMVRATTIAIITMVSLAILCVALSVTSLIRFETRVQVQTSTPSVDDTNAINGLVNEFARTVTQQDWQGNSDLFAAESVIDFHRAFTYLAPDPTTSLLVDNQWTNQMAVFAAGIASNHLLITNCNISRPSADDASIRCIGFYSYTFNYSLTVLVNVYPTQDVVFQPTFTAYRFASPFGWRLTGATALINATNTLLSSTDTGSSPPAGVFTRKRSRSAQGLFTTWSKWLFSSRDEAEDSIAWETLKKQVAALNEINQLTTAYAVCKTDQYIALRNEFEPNSTFCNGTLPPTPPPLEAVLSCTAGLGSIDSSCLPRTIETINAISPALVTNDFGVLSYPGSNILIVPDTNAIAVTTTQAVSITTLAVSQSTFLGTNTTCVTPIGPSCYDISSQSCATGALQANCMPDTAEFISLLVHNLTVLSGQTLNLVVGNQTTIHTNTLSVADNIFLSGPMVCDGSGAVSNGCLSLGGYSCPLGVPLAESCIPASLVFYDATITNSLNVNLVQCLGPPVSMSCMPSIGGDVTGTYNATYVASLQGITLAASTPSSGNVLTYTGGSWQPTTISLGGDVTGAYTSTTVVALQGQPVSATTPTSGTVLSYLAGTWTPSAGSLGGDVTGTFAANTVVKLRGFAVQSTTPADGSHLVWDTVAPGWKPSGSALYFGSSTQANSGTTSITIGQGASTLGCTSAIAFGNGASTASALTGGMAFGLNSISRAASSIAFGNAATTSTTGTSSIAVGNAASATGASAVSVGLGSHVTALEGIAIGANATTNSGIVIGGRANGNGGVAIGPDTNSDSGGIAIGDHATATNTGTVAIGNTAISTLSGTIAIGNGANAIDIQHAFAINVNPASITVASWGVTLNSITRNIATYTSLYATNAGGVSLNKTSPLTTKITASIGNSVLPDATTLEVGFQLRLVNRGSAGMVVQTATGITKHTLAVNTWAYYVCTSIASNAAASWDVYIGGAAL